MSRADAERRRRERGSTGESGAWETDTEGDDGLPTGIVVVALLVAVGGLADLAGGVVTAPILPVAIVFVALGATKLWVTVGLLRLRARALGVAVLLHVVDFAVTLIRLAFADGLFDAANAGVLLGGLLDVVVVGYLLVIADRFE